MPTTKKPSVNALKEAETGHKYYLQRNNKNRAPTHQVRVGSDASCDFVIAEDGVEDVHCLLQCTLTEVRVSAYGMGETKVNDARLGNGDVVLEIDDVIEIGETLLIACSDSAQEDPKMVVRNLYDTVQKAPKYHPTKIQAAAAIGLHRTTFATWLDKHRWLKKDRLKSAAIVGALAIGVGWMSFGSERAEAPVQSPTVLPAAGTLPTAPVPHRTIMNPTVDTENWTSQRRETQTEEQPVENELSRIVDDASNRSPGAHEDATTSQKDASKPARTRKARKIGGRLYGS